MRYFKVTCEQGHHGRGRSLPITFNIEAKDAYSAMRIGQRMPSVKHDKIPLACVEISKEEYILNRANGSAYHRW